MIILKNDEIKKMITNNIKQHFEDENEIKVNDIDRLFDEIYPIKYDNLAIRMKNNMAINDQSDVLHNLIDHITDKAMEKYTLMGRIFNEFASVFSKICLNEWWCVECGYHNKLIMIYNKILKPNDKLMQMCIICGFNKLDSITNVLKGKSKTHLLFKNTFRETFESKKKEENTKCKSNDNIKCTQYQRFFEFITKYSSTSSVDYVKILSNLQYTDTIQNFILPAIDKINSNDKNKKIINNNI
eukprot:133842_1